MKMRVIFHQVRWREGKKYWCWCWCWFEGRCEQQTRYVYVYMYICIYVYLMGCLWVQLILRDRDEHGSYDDQNFFFFYFSFWCGYKIRITSRGGRYQYIYIRNIVQECIHKEYTVRLSTECFQYVTGFSHCISYVTPLHFIISLAINPFPFPPTLTKKFFFSNLESQKKK